MKFAISSTAVLVALAFAGTAQADEQVITIGHSGPLSGPNAFAGKDNENGVRMAIEELNAKKIAVAGKTLKFELVSEDDQCDARTGVSVAQKFVDSKVQYVLGPYCSGVTIPASRVYSQGGTMVSTVAMPGPPLMYRIGSSCAAVAAPVALILAVHSLMDLALADSCRSGTATQPHCTPCVRSKPSGKSIAQGAGWNVPVASASSVAIMARSTDVQS